MSATILPLRSRGLAQQGRSRGFERATPERHGVKVVGLDLTVGHDENTLQEIGAGHYGIASALNLTDVRLTAAQLASQPLLRLAMFLSPRGKLHRSVSRFGTQDYTDSLYFVDGHKQVAEAEYKQVAYVLTMHPGNRIRELRKAAGLSQVELAQRTGVSQPYISQIENQDGLSLDIARMRALSREFNCAPADLLCDEDNPDRLSADERELLRLFRQSSDAQRELAVRVVAPLSAANGNDRRAA